MSTFEKLEIPKDGEIISKKNGVLSVPDQPIVPVIEGDGIGRDIMKATRRVIDKAVEKAYDAQKKIVWFDIYAGERANEEYGEWLPQDTLKAIPLFHAALKGPLTTPVGGGFRSLNVSLRQQLDLYACVRPVRHFEGVVTPVQKPGDMDVVIFRENTEDVYAGIEWQQGTDEAKKVINFLKEMGIEIREDSGVGVKPISVTGTKRIVRMAIQHAIDHNRESVTMVHKGNIMKYTEGAFRDWGYQLAQEEFAERVIAESDLWEQHDGEIPGNREALEFLPGVGRKTANVVLNEGFGQPTIAVDTHVFRVSNRTGLAIGKTTLDTEIELLRVTPIKWKANAHRYLILHGRYVCKAKNFNCQQCVINKECEFIDKNI